MLLKNTNTHKTTFSLLDLLGKDEVALSQAFAFLLASDKDCYFAFLRFLGITAKNTTNSYFQSVVTTEKKRKEGRTDIELIQGDKYHVIVECKVRKGRILRQRTQYLTAFNEKAQIKVLCFLTQERDTNKQIQKDVTIKNTSWLDIIDLYNNKHFIHKSIVTDFLKFATKNYKMRELKEILVQDVKSSTEIDRFEKFGVYRREQTFGTPIYFAPYFNRGSGRQEGITNLSKILGILTFNPIEVENFRSDLESFSSDKTQVDNWMIGVRLGTENKDTAFTYYFLDTPLKLTSALRKDSGIKKGRGKNWIAAMIPRNRCVTFSEFIKHIPELMTK
jgi:hypothetical protein